MPIIKHEDLGKFIAWMEFLSEQGIFEGKTPYFRVYLLCLFTGLRFYEAATLEWSNVNLKEGRIKIARQYAKMNRDHIVYASSYIVSLLKKQRQSSISNYVFPLMDRTGHIQPRSSVFPIIEQLVLRYHYSSHANRRSFFCFAMLECKIPFPIVQKMMAHKSKGGSVAEKHYFLMEQFKPGGLKAEFEMVSDGLIQLRDDWLAENGHNLKIQTGTLSMAKWKKSQRAKAISA